jgi:SAM-dependent methyltransferase
MSHPVKLRVYPEAAYGGITRYDGTLLYYSRVNALIDENTVVLDYGCGRGMHLKRAAPYYRELCTLRGKAAKVIGVDVGSDGEQNANLDEFHRIEDATIPLASETVDLCHSDWVVEHLTDIDKTFGEIRRVLKPGGYFCFRTPTRFHYTSVGAAIVPFHAHHKLRRLLGHVHEEKDVFPVTYSCNTKWKACRLLRRHGFDPMISYHRGPSHLMGLGYWAGVLGRWIEEISPLILCHEIHGFAKKKA